MTITELEQSKKQFLTAKEAADFIGMSIRTFYDLCDEDELPFRVVKMRGAVVCAEALVSDVREG